MDMAWGGRQMTLLFSLQNSPWNIYFPPPLKEIASKVEKLVQAYTALQERRKKRNIRLLIGYHHLYEKHEPMVINKSTR